MTVFPDPQTPPPTQEPFGVTCTGVHHLYAENAPPALVDIHIDVQPGEVAALAGPSGSGKSTLLHALAGLLRPTSGHIGIGPYDVTAMNERELLRMRGTHVAVLAQGAGGNLLPYLTPTANIEFAQGAVRRSDLPQPDELLEQVGLFEHRGAAIQTLSGGEQQRLAVACALATEPRLLLVDEPTSQLDTANRDRVVDLLLSANKRLGTTVVIVTHDAEVALRTNVEIRLRDGEITQVVPHGSAYRRPSW